MMLSRRASDATRPRSTPKSWKSRTSASTRRSGEAAAEMVIEWPDLPPIDLIKDAMSRNKLSGSGVPYDNIPLGRSKPGVEQGPRWGTQARTKNVRADERNCFNIRKESLHKPDTFSFNRNPNNRWVKMAVPRARIEINAESDKYRQLYVHSAPATSHLNSDEPPIGGKLRRRSHFFTTMKSSLPPEAIRMRKEADKILKSSQEDEGDYHEEKADDTTGRQTAREKLWHRDRKRVEDILKERVVKINKPLPPEEHQIYNDYSDIKNKTAPKPYIPMKLRSDFLTHEKNQEVWRWLHIGEELSDFDYFLSVCC